MLFENRRLRWDARSVVLCCILCARLSASDLEELARFDAAPGDESRVISYIAERVGGTQEIDNTGSLTASFGGGAPHVLLIAGVDEPGYVVSGINDEGYLRLERLAEPRPHYNFDKFFTGRHVHVTTQARQPLNGAVAAPAVHFASSRGFSSTSSKGLFVDIGASNPDEVAAAGVAVLDRVTLTKDPQWLSADILTAPWIAGRAGAAILLALSERLRTEPPTGKVTLAFVTQQYYHNAGLSRVLARTAPAKVILIAPNGEEVSGVAGAAGYSSELADELRKLSSGAEFKLEKRSAPELSFGPFGETDVWPDSAQSAVIFPAVENSGTPVERVSTRKLAGLAVLIERWLGLSPRPIADILQHLREPSMQPERGDMSTRSALEKTLRRLAATAGVSGVEAAVRDELHELLSKTGVPADTDDKGNLIAKLGKGDAPAAIFIAHMDEIGFTVARISSSGAIFTDTKGGGDSDIFSWHQVTVHTAAGTIPALMTRHGNVDVGAASAAEAAALGIRTGDAVTVPKVYSRLLGSRVSARSLDDRLGCAVLIAAINRLRHEARESAKSVWFVFSVEEEAGLVGAAALAKRIGPPRVYAVDTFVTSDSPLENRRLAFARLGAGPVLRALDNSGLTPRDAVRHVVELARRNNIPIQVGVTAGGNDGSRFTAGGAVNIPIGFPLRYAHTPAETADMRDAQAAVDLVVAIARDELED